MIARSDASFTPVLELECKLQVVEVQVRKDRVEGDSKYIQICITIMSRLITNDHTKPYQDDSSVPQHLNHEDDPPLVLQSSY